MPSKPSPLVLDRALLEQILRQAVDGIIVCDAEGHLLLVNEAAGQLAQRNPEDVRLDDVRSTFGAVYENGRIENKEDCALARALKGENVVGRQVRIVHGDGSFHDIVISGTPIRDDGHRIVAAIANLSDVTERNRIEQTLSESEENFRRTFDQSPIGAAIVALDFRFVRVNRELCRITGYAEAELLKLGFPDITYPADLELDVANARRLTAGEIDQYRMEKRYIRKNGELIWINLPVRLIRDACGKPMHFLPMMEDISERKRSEMALRLTDRVVNQSRDAISIVCRDYRYQMVNPVYAAISGIPQERLIGMHVADVIGEKAFAAMAKPYLDRCLAGEDVRYEAWFGFSKQGQRYCEIQYAPLRSEDDAIEGVIVIISDITERKRAEQVLQDREREFRQLADKVPDTIARFDRQNRHLYVNSQIEPITGLPPEGFIGKSNRDLGMPDDLVSYWETEIQAVFASGEARLLEFTFPSPDGPRYFETRLVPEFGRDGAVETALGITRDITEDKRAEAALRGAEQRFRLALQAARAGCWEWYPESNKAVWTDETYRLLGYGTCTVEPSYKNWLKAVHPEDRRLADKLTVQHLESGADLDIEYRVVWADGSVHWLRGMARTQRDGTGASTGMMGVMLDITGHKRAEEALRQATKSAEHTNAAKTRFLAAASHDLRQPLQAQLLFHDLLAKENRDPALAPTIAKMGQALAAQEQMLTTLLDISRLEAGVVDVEAADFCIGELLDRLGQEFAVQAEAQGLRLRVVRCGTMVRSDAALLERTLRNLLSNAIKYTDRGGILLGCRRAGNSLRVQVWDTGSDIPAGKLSAIFGEFNQLDNPARDRSKGLGLGLSIVDRLAKLLGCHVVVQSNVGRGSMFEIGGVPLVQGPSAPRPASGRKGPHMIISKALVAVIDDDAELLEALELTLRMFGYEVVAARAAEDAVHRLQAGRRPPGVVLADYRLAHNNNGTDAIGRLRGEFGASIPGILLTGDTSPDRLKEAKRSGLQLLHKPVGADELTRAIERALAQGGAGA